MKQELNSKIDISVRPYVEGDFSQIHNLNIQEKWNNLVEKSEDTQKAWENSNVKYVACLMNQLLDISED